MYSVKSLGLKEGRSARRIRRSNVVHRLFGAQGLKLWPRESTFRHAKAQIPAEPRSGVVKSRESLRKLRIKNCIIKFLSTTARSFCSMHVRIMPVRVERTCCTNPKLYGGSKQQYAQERIWHMHMHPATLGGPRRKLSQNLFAAATGKVSAALMAACKGL